MRISVLVIAVSITVFAMLSVAEEGPWIDMQNCDMCKHLLKDPDLLNNMAHDHHAISAGMVSVCRVSPEYVDSYLEAQQGMMETAGRMMKGEPVRLCNMCKSLSEIIAAGAKRDVVESENTYIVVTTSDKPEMVEKIQAWGERTNKEMLALKQAEDPDQH